MNWLVDKLANWLRHQNFTKSASKLTCFVHFYFKMYASPQPRAFFQHLNFKKCSRILSFLTFSLANARFATAAYNFATSELTKVVRTRHALCIFTSERAFRHRCVHFFNIRTYKSGPDTSCFVYFHFRMYLSPQGRAFFRHQNLQKWSKHLMFCTFSLQNALFATAACNFWFLLWAPTSAPAALTGLLLDWPDTRIIEKTQHFATSLTFGTDVSSFFWLSRYCIFLRLTWLPYSAACQLSILSEVCYLNFLRQSTTPVQQRQSTSPVLLQYYFVQSTTPVLLRTTKY